MSRKYLALIRHGDYLQKADTPSAFQPYPLSAAGINQAKQCGLFLGDLLNKHEFILHPEVHTSTLLRAWQTAIEIKRAIRIETDVIQSELLCERSVGAMANLTIKEIENIVEQDPRLQSLPIKWKSDSYFQLPFPGAESLMMAGERVKNYVLEKLNSVSDNSLLVVVGHGASIRHAAHLLGILPFHKIDQLSMYHAEPVVFSWDSHHWQKFAGDWKVRKTKTEYTD